MRKANADKPKPLLSGQEARGLRNKGQSLSGQLKVGGLKFEVHGINLTTTQNKRWVFMELPGGFNLYGNGDNGTEPIRASERDLAYGELKKVTGSGPKTRKAKDTPEVPKEIADVLAQMASKGFKLVTGADGQPRFAKSRPRTKKG